MSRGSAHLEQLADMLSELGVGAVNALARLAAQLDLPARLQGDLRVVAAERDDVAVLFFRLPAKALDQSRENAIDAARAEIRNRLAGAAVDADFFVLSADPPALARFARLVKVGFQLVVFLND